MLFFHSAVQCMTPNNVVTDIYDFACLFGLTRFSISDEAVYNS